MINKKQRHTVLVDGVQVLEYIGTNKDQAFAELKRHRRANVKQIVSVSV